MLFHPLIRFISRRVYSHIVHPVPILRNFWWTVKENIYNHRVRGELVKVELSANCNARCSFCWMFQSDQKPAGLMTLDNFKKFVDINKQDFVKRRVRIQPFFNGESLTHPHFFEMMDYLVASDVRFARLDSNLGVKKDMKRLMSYPWPIICANIAGVTKEVHEKIMKTKFDVVMQNLRELFAINRNRIFVKVTPVKDNIHQLKAFPEFIRSLGGDPARIEIGTTGFNTPAMAKDEDIHEFFREVVSSEVESYLRFTYDLSQPRFDIRAKRPGCHFLQDCVTYDGKLTICCQDQFGTLNVGSAFNTPFFELKQSHRYNDFRRQGIGQKFEMCQECN